MKDFLSFNFYNSVDKLPRLYAKLRYPLAYDHFIRYKFFKSLVIGNVLDVACGSGWGTYTLSQNPKVTTTLGIDLNEQAFKFAEGQKFKKVNYSKFNLLQDTPLSAGINPVLFDTIVCFEIIEHFTEKDVLTFLSTVKKFANKDTKVYFSTPNKDVFSPLKYTWLPYHPVEYNHSQLTTLLNNCGFKVNKVYFQRPVARRIHLLLSTLFFGFAKIINQKYYNQKVFKYLYAIFVRFELLVSKDSITERSVSSKYLIAECTVK